MPRDGNAAAKGTLRVCKLATKTTTTTKLTSPENSCQFHNAASYGKTPLRLLGNCRLAYLCDVID